MSKWMLAGSALLLAALAVFAPAAANPAAQKFTVRSTLHGKKMLPHRIAWVARADGATEVKFVIDGKVRWIEHNPPYSYSDDGGYLVTSWLSAGRHRFTVQAKSVSGAKATETVVARVVATPDPPAELAGSWNRTIGMPVPPDPAYPGDAVPAGTWTIVFDRRWIESHFPGTFDPDTSPQTGAGNILLDDYVAGPQTLKTYGAVTTHPPDPRSAAGGGWWCGPGGPNGTYTWSVNGDSLTLTPAPTDRCSQRSGVFAGTWTRVHS
jgi:hypothetical protein